MRNLTSEFKEENVPLLFQELAAIASFIGAAITAIIKGHEAYQRFKRRKKRPARQRPKRIRAQSEGPSP
jgi:hypothetical protein